MILSYIKLVRLNRPAGFILLALPCFMGVFLVIKNLRDFSFYELLKILMLFGLGSVFMRSAGCIVNDIFDRKFDAQVARTMDRPLANGDLTLNKALILLAILLSLSLLIVLQFNLHVLFASLGALVLVGFYPLMKRITFYPQLFLGITFNYGILLADLAINKKIHHGSWLLFAAAICWTLIYDTIYAFQDIEDDLKIGVKSTAIKFSNNPRLILSSLVVLMSAPIFYLALIQNFGPLFYATIIFALAYELILILKCDYSDASQCLRAFRHNIVVGVLLLLAVVVG